jgi:hypothetical protein
MPLLPFLPVILWMGMMQVSLGVTHGHTGKSIDDPDDLTMHRGSTIPFPTPLPASAA